MTSRAVSHTVAAARLTAALLAGAGLLALGACEQRPEPHPAYTEAPPPPPAPLAGEPDAAPTMAPPPETAAPAPPPSPDVAPPAPPPVDQGLVAMAPIPNPEDGGPVPPSHRWGYGRHAWREEGGPVEPRHHRRHWRVHHAYPVAPTAPRASAPHVVAQHPALRPAPHPATKPAQPAKPHTAQAPVPAPVPAHPKPAAHEQRATTGQLAAAKTGHHHHHGANATANGTANATGNATGNTTGDARADALRSALSTALAKGAVLSVPKAPPEGQAADVTLTVPADFYDTLQKEAGKQAMGDAAASVNLDATLSGDGWSIIPSGAQSQPLHAGQPTVFKWTVTAVKSATGAAAGPLRADVNADLLGGGSQTLALGAVDQQGAGSGSGKWWGAALLAIVVLLGLGFLFRGRTAAAAATPANGRRRNGEIRRPFDMNNGNGDYRP